MSDERLNEIRGYIDAGVTDIDVVDLFAEVERLRAELAAPVADEDVRLVLRVLKAGDGTRRDGELLERAIRQAEAGRDAARTDAEHLRAELAERCDMDDCEKYREWLSGEKADADKRARRAEAGRDRLRAVVEKAHELRRHGPATGPAWRAWDHQAETVLRAGEGATP